MPTYELAMMLRKMTKPELVMAIKRTAESIMDKGGIIRQLQNLGSRALPNKTSRHGLVHREGTYFIINLDAAPKKVEVMYDEFLRDVDIIRQYFHKVEETEKYECTLHEEMLPPSYRADVQEMIQMAKRKEKPKYKYNCGMNYYPFQR